MIAQTWLVKMVLAHLLTDFVLQPRSWVLQRKTKHFRSGLLYLHGAIAGITALLAAGWQLWPVALAVALTHILIDGWKSYRKESLTYFLLDQLLHLSVIAGCWLAVFGNLSIIIGSLNQISFNSRFWVLTTAVVLLTNPAGIFIGQMTRDWRARISNPESLENAGKWIGIIERLIVFLLVMVNQYAAISLLIAAKGIIRFNEKDRPEVKTEYLVIGTLLSIAMAMITGMAVKAIY